MASPKNLPRERERLADRMMLTLGGSSAILAHNLAALGSHVGFPPRIGDDNFGDIALHPLQQTGVHVSCVRRTHAQHSEDGGLLSFCKHERWRNLVTYAGTIAELTWDAFDFDYLTDSRHLHVSSLFSAARVGGAGSRIVSPDERCCTDCVAGHE